MSSPLRSGISRLSKTKRAGHDEAATAVRDINGFAAMAAAGARPAELSGHRKVQKAAHVGGFFCADLGHLDLGSLRPPQSPMRRIDVNTLFRLRLDPATVDTPAGENQRVRAILVDHGEFQIEFKWGVGDGLPHLLSLDRISNLALISINPGIALYEWPDSHP
jgi:hypothetical protein